MTRTPLFAAVMVAIAGCGGSPPSGTDAGPIDAAVPTMDAASVACAADRDCDDGVFCNGMETCSAGRCVGRMLACDDGIGCTTDTCVEASRTCTSTPPDHDGDGFGDIHCYDAHGTSLGTDCDDDDASAFPSNVETCDMHDEDCDPTTLGGMDADHDGAIPSTCCNPTPTGMACGRDCDDTQVGISELATEVCDAIDNDCDGATDEHVTFESWPDADGDGFGDRTATPEIVCLVPSSRANEGRDCDDGDRRIHPYQTEECNGTDDDCDGATDESTASACNDAATGTTGECIGGRCIVTRCDGTHYDCNGNDADGCEADLCNAASSCGRCGRTCGSFTYCGAGLCPGFNPSLGLGGILTDVDGMPVANATITSIDTCPVVVGHSGADGMYTLGPAVSIPSIVRIEAPGYPTHVVPLGRPLITQALLDAWLADPDRASSPSSSRAILVLDYDATGMTVIHDGILGASNEAVGMDLLPSAGPGARQVFFDVVPGRTQVGGSRSDGAGCSWSCGPVFNAYLEAGAVTYLGNFSCSGVCS